MGDPVEYNPVTPYQPQQGIIPGMLTNDSSWLGNSSQSESNFFNNYASPQQPAGSDGYGPSGPPDTTKKNPSAWWKDSENLSTVFQGLSALTSAYLGFQQLKQAKEGFKFQKDAFNKNFANSVSTYNTSLEDRIRGRTSEHTGKEGEVQQYLAAHKL